MFKTLELPGGFAPLAPLPGLCPAPTGGLKRPQDPSPNNFAPPISNSWLRPCIGNVNLKHAIFYIFEIKCMHGLCLTRWSINNCSILKTKLRPNRKLTSPSNTRTRIVFNRQFDKLYLILTQHFRSCAYPQQPSAQYM